MVDQVDHDYANTPAADTRPTYGYAPADPSASPFATIVTPFYNAGEIFDETARTVFRQSFQQWEWLIVNDGTTDRGALALLDAYRRCDSRVRVIDHPTNLGLSAARNTGFREARASYVVQLDSDDLLEPTAVEKWCWFLESFPEFAFAKGYTIGFGVQCYLWRKGFHNGADFLRMNLVNPTSIVRRSAHEVAGGYDEADRGGLMDWDFWLRCASAGLWGGTVPEYLDWYRRRRTHADLWPDFDEGVRQQAYGARLRKKYPKLWKNGFPRVEPRAPSVNDALSDELPCENRLAKQKRRLLLLVPWLSCGGADKFNLDVLAQLTRLDWEVTIATTLGRETTWGPEFARHTPDIFVLENFLREVDYPRFLRYLIHSRQIDAVLISHSELGYKLLPYLRAHCPDVAFADFCHIEEPHWKNGGYPRFSVEYHTHLDLTIVSSEHLKGWMAGHGASPDRLRVCYTNVDAEEWRPDPELRSAVRRGLDLDEGVPLVLFVGRICPQKQPSVLVETLSQLRRKGSNFVALVAGTGPDSARLRALVRRRRLEARVHLVGEVSSQRVRELMAAADVLLLPSKWEGISLAIFEAMACGLPVVAADVGGQRELVTHECGVLVTPGTEREEAARYAHALAELISSPERRARVGRAARERVSAFFPLSNMGQQMDCLIEEARHLHAVRPRRRPTVDDARPRAAEAIESLQLSRVTARLWAERSGSSLGQRCYLVVSRLFEPFFQWGVRRGWTWLFPLGDRIKRILLR